MQAKNPKDANAELIEETSEITLAELTRTCRVQTEWVMELIEEGVLEPLQPRGPQWRFSATSIVRIHKARRLQNDLGVNLAGIALTASTRSKCASGALRGLGLSRTPNKH
jgi:chaperone modulatory protein CbpM